ncbi:hypothetical protein WN51_10058 [Melipona quadrifasciata]|uniref:Uncharacterized protein n=1 Tax=Melipona quadrifasciata TaxID=166423 RepID=A0A0M9ADL2_9HYME|nr:hypothetical protein WN51_10058 [Melipona quadrifasciata]
MAKFAEIPAKNNISKSKINCLAGGAEDTSAVRESRATFMSTDDWIATRVYVAATIKRVIVTGCVPLKAETVAGPGWKKNSFGFSQAKNEKSLKREIDLFQPNWKKKHHKARKGNFDLQDHECGTGKPAGQGQNQERKDWNVDVMSWRPIPFGERSRNVPEHIECGD